MNKIIISILILTLFFLIIFSIPLEKSENESQLKGIGVDCFKQCTNVCLQNESKTVSFAAYDETCSCTCKNNNQFIFKIK